MSELTPQLTIQSQKILHSLPERYKQFVVKHLLNITPKEQNQKWKRRGEFESKTQEKTTEGKETTQFLEISYRGKYLGYWEVTLKIVLSKTTDWETDTVTSRCEALLLDSKINIKDISAPDNTIKSCKEEISKETASAILDILYECEE